MSRKVNYPIIPNPLRSLSQPSQSQDDTYDTIDTQSSTDSLRYQIMVQSMTGTKYFVDVSPNTTVRELKQLLAVQTGTDMSGSYIQYSGKVLDDTHNKKLSDYSVNKNSTLIIVQRQTGGMQTTDSTMQHEYTQSTAGAINRHMYSSVPDNHAIGMKSVDEPCACDTEHIDIYVVDTTNTRQVYVLQCNVFDTIGAIKSVVVDMKNADFDYDLYGDAFCKQVLTDDTTVGDTTVKYSPVLYIGSPQYLHKTTTSTNPLAPHNKPVKQHHIAHCTLINSYNDLCDKKGVHNLLHIYDTEHKLMSIVVIGDDTVAQIKQHISWSLCKPYQNITLSKNKQFNDIITDQMTFRDMMLKNDETIYVRY